MCYQKDLNIELNSSGLKLTQASQAMAGQNRGRLAKISNVRHLLLQQLLP